MDTNHFQALRKIDVGAHIEKKNNLSYLSWAYAVDTLLQQDGTATWAYGEPVPFGATLMVFCSVHAFGKTMTSQLPVMDHRNKAIPNPDAMQVNTAMQRCLAKAIALHGIGLYIYAGEDLPEQDKQTPPSAVQSLPASAKSVTRDTFEKLDIETQEWLRNHAMEAIAFHNKGRTDDAFDYLTSLELDADMKTAIFSQFDAPMRSALKKISTAMKEAA